MPDARGRIEPEAAPEPAERTAFMAEITQINLRRILWVSVAGLLLDIAFALYNAWQPAMQLKPLAADLAFDVAASAVLLPISCWCYVRPIRWQWKHAYVLAFAVINFAALDSYHFQLVAALGDNLSYVFGLMVASGILLLDARVLLPMLAVNHGVFCAFTLLSDQTLTRRLAQVLEGSAAVVLAAIAGWFVYRTKRDDFSRQRLLARRSAELADANAEIAEVMAIAAHDLRSPLHTLRTLLEMVRAQRELSPERRDQMLAAASGSCGDMLALVERLLAAHSAEQRAGELRLAAADLRATCAAAVERARPRAEQKEQRIAVALPEAAAMARVDPAVLGQVLDNLLGNALKFSPSGAAIELVLAPAERGGWRVNVCDEGPGVPPEERELLFQKFRRGSAATTGGESSTGLGLFIVKTVTEAMGGTVSYAPRERVGSVFGVELPAA